MNFLDRAYYQMFRKIHNPRKGYKRRSPISRYLEEGTGLENLQIPTNFQILRFCENARLHRLPQS